LKVIVVRITASVKCPRCGTPMSFVLQSERTAGHNSVAVSYMYVCHLCKFRYVTDTAEIRCDTDRLIVLHKRLKSALENQRTALR